MEEVSKNICGIQLQMKIWELKKDIQRNHKVLKRGQVNNTI